MARLKLCAVFIIGFILVGCESKQEMEKNIHSAALSGDFKTVERLLKKDSSLAKHQEPTRGQTPLHETSDDKIAELLIEKGAQVNIIDRYNLTPLHTAKSEAVVDVLINNGGDLQAKDDRKRTPIFTAANAAVVAALVRHGADIFTPVAPIWSYDTPLYEAVMDNRIETVQKLIELNADVNTKDSNDDTLLHKAAQRGSKEIVQILLDKGLWVDVSDKLGATPLHYAVLNNHVAVAEVLLAKGANVNAKLSKYAAVMDYASAANRVGPPPPGKNWGQSEASGYTPLKLAKSDAMKDQLRQHGAIE
jgi:ankyrin repeat protein